METSNAETALILDVARKKWVRRSLTSRMTSCSATKF